MNQNRLRLGLVVFAMLAAGAYLLMRREPSIGVAKASSEALQALEQGDVGQLYRLSYEHEKKALDLTPRKVQEVYELLIRPRLQLLKPSGPVQRRRYRDHQAITWREYKSKAGQQFDVEVLADIYPEGGRYGLTGRLTSMWIVQYCMAADLPPCEKNVYRAIA